MLRRTKNQILNGKPLLQLPERTLELVECSFNASEKEFYRLLENRMTSEVNKLVQSDNVNYTHVLVLLLRLRQGELLVQSERRIGLIKLIRKPACNHPSLVSKDYRIDKDAAEPKAAKDDEDDTEDLAAMFGQLGMSGAKKCQLCQTTSVAPLYPGDLLIMSPTACQLGRMQHTAVNADLLPNPQGLHRTQIFLSSLPRSKKSWIS